MRRQKGNQPLPLLPSARGQSAKAKSPQPKIDTVTWIIALLVSCCISFYAGIWTAWTMRRDCGCDALDPSLPRSRYRPVHPAPDCAETCLSALIGGTGDLARRLDGRLDAIVAPRIEKALEEDCPSVGEAPATARRFPESMSHFASGMARVNRKDLFDTYDFGVPMSDGADRQDVLMIYDGRPAMPFDAGIKRAAERGGEIPSIDAKSATANCDAMNVVFVHNPHHGGLRQCMAIVGGQYQGYHVQRWMRVVGEGAHGKVVRSAPLTAKGRLTKASGYDEFLLPKPKNILYHQDIMRRYLINLNEIKVELGRILEKIAIKNTIVVSTVNQGQSDLLMNLVCSSRSRGFELRNFLVFPTDLFSKELAEGMGIATYYAETLMEKIPREEAARYGDETFAYIMMAKVICVHLVSELGYDILFQDVDVIWFKDPLGFFHNPESAIANFDVYFQDDGSRQERYAPYSANSGFYYIRNNGRTRHLFRTMMYSGDLIFACRSHQQVLIQLLDEANSLTGLRVKVLSRDGDDFPGGYHYHMRKDYMKKFVSGKKDPYIWHMSWTLNKDDKLKFLRQMGMWYVKDECNDKAATGILLGESDGDDIGAACCSAEPLFTCHYRDKPSIKSCADSPPKDNNQRSFW